MRSSVKNSNGVRPKSLEYDMPDLPIRPCAATFAHRLLTHQNL
jgi:hypothetical protein